MPEVQEKKTVSFDDVELKGNPDYFGLNDQGMATWKCSQHGFCEYDIDSFLSLDLEKFLTTGCPLCMDNDQIEEELSEIDSAGAEKIKELLSFLNDDQKEALVNEYWPEYIQEEYGTDYVNGFIAWYKEEYLGDLEFAYFIEQVKGNIYEMFGSLPKEQKGIDKDDTKKDLSADEKAMNKPNIFKQTRFMPNATEQEFFDAAVEKPDNCLMYANRFQA